MRFPSLDRHTRPSLFLLRLASPKPQPTQPTIKKKRSALLAAAATLAAASGATAFSGGPPPKLVLGSDPLDISNELPKDYRNWASVMSQVLLKKEGSEEGAIDALGRVMLAAHGHLAKVANGEELFPRFHLTDPVFARESHGLGSDLEEMVGKVAGTVKGKMPVKSVTKFAAAKTFFNYAPCVLSESTVRVSFPLGVVWLVLGGSRGAGTRPRGRGLGCTGQRDNA
jgi:hypothetical protein